MVSTSAFSFMKEVKNKVETLTFLFSQYCLWIEECVYKYIIQINTSSLAIKFAVFKKKCMWDLLV